MSLVSFHSVSAKLSLFKLDLKKLELRAENLRNREETAAEEFSSIESESSQVKAPKLRCSTDLRLLPWLFYPPPPLAPKF